MSARTALASEMFVGAIGEETPLEPARSLDRAPTNPLTDYKNWNRGTAFVQLQWSRSGDDTWWLLDHVQPAQLEPYGVFVIWRNGNVRNISSVMYVGRGSLRDEFARCRRDPLFRGEGLYVTWAAVSDPRMIDSIAVYLYQHLQPIWGDVPPMIPPLACNLPLTA